MATSRIEVTQGSGKNIATYSFSEDAVTKEAQRVALVRSDGVEVVDAAGFLGSKRYAWNGSTWEETWATYEFTLLSSAARTTTAGSPDQTNRSARGVALFVNVTAIAATPIVTPLLQWKDPISGVYFQMTAFSSGMVSAVGGYVLTFYPGAIETTALVNHEVMGLALPRTWRLVMSHGDADSITYSVAGAYLL